MRLLKEQTSQIEVLNEASMQGEKKVYLHGIFLQSEVKNRNGRVYPKSVMEAAVDKYINEYVSQRMAIGELSHPEYPMPKPEEAAILIESLEWQGDNVIGKALVLNTPKGQIVKGLLEGGYRMGVSSRGLGNLVEKRGVPTVTDFLLNAIDAVHGPSAPDAYVNAINESLEWECVNGIWQAKQKKLELNESELLEAIEKLLIR